MILRIEDLNDICSKLLSALDTNHLSEITETLEMKNENSVLTMSITNREYIVKCRIPTFNEEDFHVTVNAAVFLKLISKLNTETVEFIVDDNTLVIKSNGVYKLPMIYEGENLLEIPDIVIENVTNTFNIPTNILHNILNYNSKELSKGAVANPVQKLYYVDNKGCITFTTGACVTTFSLPAEVNLLFNQKIVRLFKLFTDDEVTITIGEDLNGDILQRKIKFKTDVVELTSVIISEENMINSVPCEAIRGRAMETYPYSVVLNRLAFLNIIDRLMLFTDSNNIIKPYGLFEFNNKSVSIYDRCRNNTEVLNYENEINVDETESIILDFNDIKLVLESIKDDFITLNFGNQQAVVIQRPGVYNVIPECII